MEQIDISNPDHITIYTVKGSKTSLDSVLISIKKEGITITYSIPISRLVVKDMRNS